MPEPTDDDAVVVAFSPRPQREWFAHRPKSHKEERGFQLLDRMRCTLRGLGYRGPLVALLHGMDHYRHRVASLADWRVVQVTLDLRELFGKALHDEPGKARGALRLPTNSTAEHRVTRSDGWATVLKLCAWNLTQYRRILLTDLDVDFEESPSRAFQDAARQGISFLATQEVANRHGYSGLNTHLVLLQPSRAIFMLLWTNAALGHFVPYTHTEQDVVETIFPPLVRTEWPPQPNDSGVLLPKHTHAGYFWVETASHSRLACRYAAMAPLHGNSTGKVIGKARIP